MSDRSEQAAGDADAAVGERTSDGGTPGDRRGAEPEAAVVAELERLLVAEGPLTVEELAARFAAGAPELAAGLVAERPATDLVARLATLARHADEVWKLPDGRLAPVLHHLRRATFTHRLTASELARGAVDLCPDLVALALPRSFRLGDGTEVHVAARNEQPRAAVQGSIIGPAGWLSGHVAGDLVALRYDGHRAELTTIAEAAVDDAAAGVVRTALRSTFAELPTDRAPEVHRLVVDTMGGHPASFSVPVPPVAELLPSVGLAVREAWVGPADRPWTTPPEAARRRRLEELLAGADGCCRGSARRALEAWHGWMRAAVDDDDTAAAERVAAAPGRDEATGLAADIDHGPVASLLAEVARIGPPVVSLRRLGAWAGEIAHAAERPAAGVEYLRGLGADASGDPCAAERHLQAGLEVAPDHPACLGLLAELAEDRGDARRSLALLRRAGRPPGDEAMRELEPFLVGRTVGRNEPCPCGSGRKFKQCCAHRPVQRPLLDRCRWLLNKATRHAVRADPLAVRSLQELFGADGGTEAMALVGDMLLFANRGLARYLDARGDLLPADELACARSWVDRPMRLVGIDTSAAGPPVVVDLRTGEPLTLDDPVTATIGEGDAILTRPLPVGERWLLSGAVLRVPAAGRTRALEMLEGEVRPFHLLQLLVDMQVDALRP